MIIIENYERRLISGKMRWFSLVECEGTHHKGDKRRIVYKDGISRGVGSKHCKSCANLGENNPYFGKISHFRGRHHTQEVVEKLRIMNTGQNHPLFGSHRTPEIKEKLRLLNLGKIVSKKTRKKLSQSLTGKFRGDKSPHWRHDLTQEEREEKYGRYYDPFNRVWCNNILSRDKYTCQITGIVGGRLAVHHLYNWENFPEKRLDANNGITIRADIHILFHIIYGKRYNTPEQFLEFSEYMKEILEN